MGDVRQGSTKENHNRKDTENKAMREAVSSHEWEASPRHQAKDQSNLTDSATASTLPVQDPFYISGGSSR
jgi:hypothetical protein